jgi:hypothetical protein
MPPGEITNPGVRIIRKRSNGEIDLEELERSIVRRLWGRIPGWAKGAVATITILGGGGGASAYIGQWVPAWETKQEAAVAHKALQGQIDELRKELPEDVATKTAAKVIDAMKKGKVR